VLVVSAAARTQYRRPLVATDCEDSFTRTCETALRVVGPDVGPVTLFHSFHVPFETRFGRGPSREAAAWQSACREEARSSLERSLRAWRGSATRFVPVVRKGDPRGTILAEAERRKADLIALGTHGRSGVAHAFLGSVAEWVIRAATIDVLVARPVHFTFHAP
jgi:nucleotide-binding universal stress UspA family protein